MKFRELVDKYVWDDVCPVLLRLYPDEEQIGESYEQVYETLRSLQPASTKLRICIETVTDGLDGTTYESVSGKDGTTDRETALKRIGMTSEVIRRPPSASRPTDWTKWLGMEIDPETVARYSEPEIIGHCLWEMTFYGFSREKIQKFIDDMEESIRSGERHTLEDLEKLFDDLDEIDEDVTPQKAGDVP